MTTSRPATGPLDAIVSVETFVISIPRDVPYLGPLKDGESINAQGYLIRKGNKTIYPTTDQSILVNLSGRGDKDAYEIARLRGEPME